MERELRVKEDSIDSSGIKKDYKEAIIEYIWNGFDAGATQINISYQKNDLDGIENICIEDNGTGIVYENLENTFDAFLSSEKRINSNLITTVHGNKGKGRFSFLGFANNCKWKTTYKNENKKYTFSIEINGQTPNKYYPSEKEEISTNNTGTKVTIYNVNNLMEEQMKSSELKNSLLESFSWYLYLKKNENCKIILNGDEIRYTDFIDDKLSEDFEEIINDEKFNIFFIKWKGDVKYKYYFHMLDENNNQRALQHTKYNNNGIGFVHSVFITSEYFNGFESFKYDKEEINGQIKINADFKKNEKDETYKLLLKKLDIIVNQKYKSFIKEKSNNIIKTFEEENIFPVFTKDIYGKIRKTELINVVKEVYCTQPKIFKGASTEQKKKRMDIFMCAKRPLDVYPNSSIKEENIILELKAPTVPIGAEIFQQIESYMEIIRKEPQFNSSLREWKFYAISNEVSDFIIGKYEENEAKGQPFLVKALRNYKIFIMTWDDVFKNFEHKHRFLYDKLIIDKEKLEEQFEKQDKSREGANKLTEDINKRAIV